MSTQITPKRAALPVDNGLPDWRHEARAKQILNSKESPQARARAVMAFTEEIVGDGVTDGRDSRAWPRRAFERLRHNERLRRLFVGVIGWATVVLILYGLFGGE